MVGHRRKINIVIYVPEVGDCHLKEGIMGNKWDEMRAVYKEAEMQIQSADAIIEDMAKMLVGRLRKINSYHGGIALQRLKRELRAFNIQTRRWKS